MAKWSEGLQPDPLDRKWPISPLKECSDWERRQDDRDAELQQAGVSDDELWSIAASSSLPEVTPEYKA